MKQPVAQWREQQAEASKLDKAIAENLEGLWDDGQPSEEIQRLYVASF